MYCKKVNYFPVGSISYLRLEMLIEQISTRVNNGIYFEPTIEWVLKLLKVLIFFNFQNHIFWIVRFIFFNYIFFVILFNNFFKKLLYYF